MAFSNLKIKMQRKKSQLKKFGKFTDNDGDKITLTILTNNSNADEYAIQASQDTISNPDDIDVELENCDMDVEEEVQDDINP